MPETRMLDQRIAKAVSHPLRRDVLEFILEHGEASPNEVANGIGASLGTVSYHVHILRDLECIELVRTEPRRGALEHYYRSRLDLFIDDSEWARLPVAVRRQLAGQTSGQLVREMAEAAGHGGFDAEQVHIDRVPLRLDEDGWRELSDLLTATLSKVADIQRRSDARSDEVQPSILGILHFRRADR